MYVLLVAITISVATFGQVLKPYFDKDEYIELLKINQKTHKPIEEWTSDTAIAMPQHYSFDSRSEEIAFDNLFDLWVHKTHPTAVFSIRGSIATEASFLANFYAAMIPAKGDIQLDSNLTFKYKLAEDPNAAVHVGWLISTAYLSQSILFKIDSLYSYGIKDFIITGHSQGGGIAYLLTAQLKNLQLDSSIPDDIQFKTYCSAGPKPGNLFFAYEYEKITEGGWAYNVVNVADWVPDVPFSLQTINDFTEVNPFTEAEQTIGTQRFPKKQLLRHIYKKLSQPSLKAQKNYEKFLGEMVAKEVKKQIPSLELPQYYSSNYYVRTGNTIVLVPDDEYYIKYPKETDSLQIWTHHFIEPYLFLANKLE